MLMFYDTANLWNVNPLYVGLIITDTEILASCFPSSWQFISGGCHSFPSCFLCLGTYLGNDLCWWWFWSSQGRFTSIVCNRNSQILIFYWALFWKAFLGCFCWKLKGHGSSNHGEVATLLWQFTERLNFQWEYFHSFIEGQPSHSFGRIILLFFTARILNTTQSKNLAGFCILQPELMRNWNLNI